MSDIKDLKVVFTGDATQLSSTFSTVRDDSIRAKGSLSEVQAGIGKVGEEAKSRKTEIENFTKAFVFGNVIFSLATDAARMLKESFKTASEGSASLEASMAQINTLLVTTHDASGQSAEGLNKMADKISQTTPISKQAALAAAQMLLPFTNIGSTVFPGVLSAADDLATHLNHGLAPSSQQVADAAKQLGRAFNDPSTGMTLLKRAGISLTSTQIEQIKTLQKNGDLVGAQTLLLKDLSNTMGGSAAAAAGTFDGKVDILKNRLKLLESEGINRVKSSLKNLATFLIDHEGAIANLAKTVGSKLGPSFSALWNTISTQLMPALEKFWKEIIVPLLPVLGGLLVTAIWLVTNGLDLLLKIIAPVMNFISDHKQLVLDLAIAFGTLAAAMAFGAIFDALNVGFNTLRLVTIPSVMTSVETMRATIASPLVMGSIAIGAALIAIDTVYNKGQQTIALLQKMNEQEAVDQNSESGAMKSVIEAYHSGKITKTQYQDFFKHIAGNAGGTDYWGGGMTWVGEKGPELLNLPRGSQVINNDASTKMSKGGEVHLTVNVGVVAGNNVSDLASVIYRELQRLSRANGFNGSLPNIGIAPTG